MKILTLDLSTKSSGYAIGEDGVLKSHGCITASSRDVEKRINSALNLKSHEALKDDLAYRFAYYLLKSTRPADAESILKKYLPNESQLLGLCENIYIKEAENHLLDFNRKIKSVIEGSMTVEQATSFLKEIDNYKALISPKLPDTTSKFNSYKSKLESYILKAMFIEEKYEDAFEKMLLMYPEFIENDNQFRTAKNNSAQRC